MGACALLSALMFWTQACSPPHAGYFDLSSHGLSATVSGRDWAAAAVDEVNLLLLAKDGMRLTLGGEGARFEAGHVPVYLIGAGLERSEAAMTPANCRCILVNPRALAESVRSMTDNPSADLPINLQNWASLILLHEAGHISQSDARAAAGASLAEGGDADERQSEFDADKFAAERIRAAFEPGQDGFSKAMLLALEISNASWNLQASRYLDHFAQSALNDASLLIDKGYSHPNFELRVLVVNELIQQSETARQLRESFEALREEAGGASPLLWQRKP